MGAPRRRVSKTRGRDRRTHYKSIPPQLISCPQCKTLILPHIRCPNCGTYNGKEVIVNIGKKEKAG